METQKIITNIKVVQNFLTLQYEGKVEEAFEKYADPNFKWVVSTNNNKELTKAISWAGYEHRGLEGYKKLNELLFGEYEPLEFNTNEFYEVENKVFMIGDFKFKHYTTGKIAESDFVGIFNLKENKITDGQFYENTLAVAAGRTNY
ncbi:hypothetical protein J8281_02475 [Aquimarina sp. U1-2]|uniref:nuclear transport factor 2 family protein n=1 Tax=Aquimarina sp. U1-2 TaxID=2823141 RepID=UPI001AECD36D|nr:hypothetical protein [Aquimarina sp. U1-2]MBP2831041.1 hypothetical protein [Aquimarina sp. U1-2]